jgi:glycosyltransferase involved in cell wall biosynthesis
MEKTDRKRILILTERFFPEDFLVNDVATEFSGAGYSCSVLTQQPSYPMDTLYPGYKNSLFSVSRFHGMKVYRVRTVLGYKRNEILKIFNYLSFSVLTSVYAFFLAPRIDRVFIYHTGPLTLAASSFIFKAIYRKPVFIWTQDVWPDTVYAYGFPQKGLFSIGLETFVRFIYGQCDGIFVSSEGFTKSLRGFVKSGIEIKYVPQWPPSSLLEGIDSQILLNNGINFTFAGNIGTMQNLENVILGFERAVRHNQRLFLNIFGDGSVLERLKSVTAERRIPNVVFHGRIKMTEMLSLLKKSDFLILPLVSKKIIELTLPAKFQAYLAAEKPIFAVCKGAAAEAVESEKIGMVADPDNIEEIAKGFSRLSELEKSQCDDIKQRMHLLLTRKFSKKQIVNTIIRHVVS